MKKVLVLVQENVGGAERMAVLIGKLLNPLNYNIIFVVVSKRSSKNSILDFMPPKASYRRLQVSSPLRLIWKLNRVIRMERPDVVFSSAFYFSNKLLLQKFLFPSIKFIVRCENYLYTFTKKQQIITRFTYKFADKIIAQTEEMGKELVEIANIRENKIVVLQNPVDEETIKEKISNGASPFPDNKKKHFLASGRFAYQKGFDLLIEAFALVKKQRCDVDLFIIGANDGQAQKEYERVQAIVRKYKLDADVYCKGFQTNPYLYVKYADSFVLSSRWEGLPNVLIESLYLGTPVAAYKCVPVIQRIVQDHVDGYLAEPENIQSLAEAMLKTVDMGRVITQYKGAGEQEFNRLFDDVCGIR
jgi:glycosyltransferase involved in cell wall biosynthesis